jgi:hypothetical protein
VFAKVTLYSGKADGAIIMGTIAAIWLLLSAAVVLFLVAGALRNEKKAPH